MEKSENGKKIIILILIVLILIGSIMMIKLLNKQDNPKNEILNTNNVTNISDIVEDKNNNATIIDENTVAENTATVVEIEETKNTYSTSSNKDIVYQRPSTGSNNGDTNKEIENKDTTSPSLNVKYSAKGKTNQDVIVTIESNERLQSIEGWELSSDGLLLTKVYSSNCTEEIYVKDLAGNITTVNISIVNIDKVFPKVKLEYSITSYTNKDVEVKIISDKELKGIEDWTLLSNKLELIKKYAENKVEEIKVEDLAGNEIPLEINIENIDKVKPENAMITNTLFSTKAINTKLTLKDNTSGIDLNKSYYKIDTSKDIADDYSNYNKITGISVDINETVSKDGTYYLHVISVDKAGNITKNTIELYVDTIEAKVTVNYSVTSPTKNDVIVTVIANKEMKEIEGWKLSEDKRTFTKTYSENIEENVTFTDLLGRDIDVTISIKNIDKKAPVEPKLSQTIFNSKPIDNTQNISISLNAVITDNEGGTGININKCKYILNQSNKKVTDFSAANTFKSENETLHFTIKENTTYYLHILLVDKVGNESYTIHTIISDTLNPIVTREYNLKDITNQNVIVTVKSNEVLQGKDGWEVYDGGLTLRKVFDKNTPKTIETFYDLAGNSVSVDITISNIDKISPNEATISKSDFNTRNLSLRINLADNYSGINVEQCKYILDQSKTSNYSLAKTFTNTSQDLQFTVEKDGIYYLHILSVDKAGNKTETIKEIKVDTTNPEYTITYSKTDITNEDVVVTIKANEEIKNVPGWNLSSDKKTLTKTFNSNTDTNLVITDLLGNTSQVKVKITNIDKTNPKAEVSYSTTTQTTEPVIVSINANEKIVSTDGWTLSSDELTLTKTFETNATETVTIRDLAGNYTTVSVIVANII